MVKETALTDDKNFDILIRFDTSIMRYMGFGLGGLQSMPLPLGPRIWDIAKVSLEDTVP